MKTIHTATLIILLFICVCGSVFSTETRVSQLFIVDRGVEYRHAFLYNASGDILLETKYVQSDNKNTWLRQNQTEWFYTSNESADKVVRVERVFENNAWKNTDEIETHYNRVAEIREETIYRYVSGVKTFVKKNEYEYSDFLVSEIKEYTYQNDVARLSLLNTFVYEDELLIQQKTDIYSSGNVLDSTFISAFTYDSSDRLKTQVVKKKIGAVYQNTDSITWFYNTAGMLVSQRLKKWSAKNGDWENSQIIDYEYDSNSKLIAETYLQWGGMHWESIYRYEYRYENNVQVKRTLMTLLYREWRDMISIHYSDFYDNKARTMESEYEFWGGDKGEFTASYIPFDFNGELVIRKAESIRVDYDTLSSTTTDRNGTDVLIRIYPNPSDGIFYINTEKHEILSWSVYDLKGQLIRSHVQRYNTGVVDITEQQNGIYILRVETTMGYQQQKLIKQSSH